MHAWWILPNRDQSDDLLASDGKTTLSFRKVLDPKLRPAGFSHGVPTELLEKCGPEAFGQILFAQRFGGWNGDNVLFSVATPAGTDLSGRVVHLGLLLILGPHERPRFDPAYAGLPEEDRAYASALIRRITAAGGGDAWAQSVRELSELREGSGPATNVALDRSVVRFHSLYALGPGGLTRKALIGRPRIGAVVLAILFAAGAWLAAHSCGQSGRPAVRTGVVTWHFS
jgi:hypothetical protein